MASPGLGPHEKMIVVYNVAGPISMVLKQVLFLVNKIYPYDSARQISLGFIREIYSNLLAFLSYPTLFTGLQIKKI